MKSDKNKSIMQRAFRSKKKKIVSSLGLSAVLCVSMVSGIVQGNSKMQINSEQSGIKLGQKFPSGFNGLVAEMQNYHINGKAVNRVGTSCENVIVGQRTKNMKGSFSIPNVSGSMSDTVANFENHTYAAVQDAKMMTDEEYQYLLSLVEAEATGEDLKGKTLIANVVMNRVKDSYFPDTVKDVIWAASNGIPQFSPTYDGRIYTVVPSDETKQAVKQALEGVDYSEGALYFMARQHSEKDSVNWFADNLTYLFRHGGHEFYK